MIYRQKVKVREEFPAQKDDIWMVREQGKVAETWTVIHRSKTYFIAEVVEHFPVGG